MTDLAVPTMDTKPIHKFETDPSRENKDIVAFETFVSEKENTITDLQEKGKNLEDIIDKLFYSGSENIPTGLKANIIENKYKAAISELKEWLGKRQGRGIETSVSDEDRVYCFVNEGLKDKKAAGSIYLNTKAEDTTSVFADTVLRCRNYGVHCEMEIPDNCTIEDILRSDKMVLHFGKEEGSKIIEIVEEVYKNHPNSFINKVPRFSKELKGMQGVSFGQEPEISKESFGSIRSKILAHMFEEYSLSKKRNKKYDFQSGFKYWCSEYKIDSKDPAFNIRNQVES